MPLYDSNNPRGWEAHTLVALADWLPETEGAQLLAEATGSAEEKKAKTLAKVIIGPQEDPPDGDKYTIDDLANRLVDFNIFSPTEGGKTTVIEGVEVSCVGEFGMITRRYCRESELANRQDLWLGFVQMISAMEEQLGEWMATREKPRIKGLVRQELGFGEWRIGSAQGECLFAVHTIPWGDFVETD